MEYNLTIKRNKVLIHVTTWTNLENMLSEKSQSENTRYCMIPFLLNAQSREIHRERKLVVYYLGLRALREKGSGC